MNETPPPEQETPKPDNALRVKFERNWNLGAGCVYKPATDIKEESSPEEFPIAAH